MLGSNTLCNIKKKKKKVQAYTLVLNKIIQEFHILDEIKYFYAIKRKITCAIMLWQLIFILYDRQYLCLLKTLNVFIFFFGFYIDLMFKKNFVNL